MPQVLLSQYSVVVFLIGLDGPPRFSNNIFCCKGVELYTFNLILSYAFCVTIMSCISQSILEVQKLYSPFFLNVAVF